MKFLPYKDFMFTRTLRGSAPLVLAPVEAWWGTFGPMLSIDSLIYLEVCLYDKPCGNVK